MISGLKKINLQERVGVSKFHTVKVFLFVTYEVHIHKGVDEVGQKPIKASEKPTLKLLKSLSQLFYNNVINCSN